MLFHLLSVVFHLVLHLNHSEIKTFEKARSPGRNGRHGNDSRTLIRGTDYFSQSYLAVCRTSGQ